MRLKQVFECRLVRIFQPGNPLYTVSCVGKEGFQESTPPYVSFDCIPTMSQCVSLCSESLPTSSPNSCLALTNLTLPWNVYLKASLFPQKRAWSSKTSYLHLRDACLFISMRFSEMFTKSWAGFHNCEKLLLEHCSNKVLKLNFCRKICSISIFIN